MRKLQTKNHLALLILMLLLCPGCRVGYLLHAAIGQARVLSGSVSVEEALKDASLSADQRERILLAGRVKAFGEQELGLRATKNYQSVYLTSGQKPIFTVSASPKDRLTRITWWFPIVGEMPYLGFFDRGSAEKEMEDLRGQGLDTHLGIADAYSTLGWFKDPLTLHLLKGTTPELVETILHEMTHTTLYVKSEGEFNEGLAMVVGRRGALRFFEETCGPSHPLTEEAKRVIEDERVFSKFIGDLMERLAAVYNSPLSTREKLDARETIFTRSLEDFSRLRGSFKTGCFLQFGSRGLNNAYLLSVALYHRYFRLFEGLLDGHGGSIPRLLKAMEAVSREKADEGNLMERLKGQALGS